MTIIIFNLSRKKEKDEELDIISKYQIFLHLISFFFLVHAPIITLLRRQLERDNEGYIKRGM